MEVGGSGQNPQYKVQAPFPEPLNKPSGIELAMRSRPHRVLRRANTDALPSIPPLLKLSHDPFALVRPDFANSFMQAVRTMTFADDISRFVTCSSRRTCSAFIAAARRSTRSCNSNHQSDYGRRLVLTLRGYPNAPSGSPNRNSLRYALRNFAPGV